MNTTVTNTMRRQDASFVLPVVTLASSTLTLAPAVERLEGRRGEPMAVARVLPAAEYRGYLDPTAEQTTGNHGLQLRLPEVTRI